MELKDFDRVRVGSGCPHMFDICTFPFNPPKPPFHYHENTGVIAITYDWGEGYIEIRRNKNNDIAIFNSKYIDTPIPEYWEDAEVIWTNRKERDPDAP